MARPYELVVFDCDGVLVDSERIAVRVDVEVMAELGWRLTEAEVVERFVGRTDDAVRRIVEEHLGIALAPDWEDRFAERYRQAFEAELQPVQGVVAALDAIDAIDVATCVASSGRHEKMRFTLGRCGLYDRFAGRIFSATEVARGKPAPDLFLHAADRMGADPTRCAVVEDSASGVEAARAAGMDVYAYAGGVTPAARLARDGVVLFDDMAVLPGLLA